MMLGHLMLAVAVATTPPDSLLSADAMLLELRKGGYTILWRHTATDRSTNDAPGSPNIPRFQQRNLSERGVSDAKIIGAVFKTRGIPVGDVIASPMFRTRETAEYAFGRVSESMLLRTLEASAEERRLLAEVPAAGTNRVLVTHHFIIERNAPGIKPGDVDEGEAAVVKTVDGKLVTVAVLKMADWRRFAEQDAASNGAPATNAGGGHGGAFPSAATHVAYSWPAPTIIPPLLEAPKYAAVAEYLRAFNSGDPVKMRHYFERYVVVNPNRTIEQRLETYEQQLKTSIGPLAISSAETGGENQVIVRAQTQAGMPATLTFTLEATAMPRVVSINIQAGG